jgi:hypothetical protein
MPEWTLDQVFGVSRDVPLNYVDRADVDTKLIDSLSRDHHIVIYGSSKQGKTCLRKHCLKDDDYLVVSCLNRWGLADLHAAILKEAGYIITLSSSKTVSGSAKIVAKAEGEVGIPLLTKGKTGGEVGGEASLSNTAVSKELELDPLDVNDIIRALESIQFGKYIVLEDFHYLPDETQRDFSFALKAFHENSKISFIVVGVWREENRLIAYNGDLTDRVYSVDVDHWSADDLNKVIEAGEALLNVQFAAEFKEELISSCFSSVHIVQEACRRCCLKHQVLRTREETKYIGTKDDARECIKLAVEEQSGRYNGFLMSFSDGFQQTDLEMPRWVIFALLNFPIDHLEKGVRLRELSRVIKSAHPKKDELNNGNITQILNASSSLQVKKNIRPIVIDYDGANRNLHVVDKGFLIWLASQDIKELCHDLDLPDPIEA